PSVERALRVLKLLQQRPSAVETIERDFSRGAGKRGQLEAALRRDAHVRLAAVVLLLAERLDELPRRLALELGPDRVIGAAEERRIGAGPRHLADAPGAERPGQGEVVGHLAPLPVPAAGDRVQDGAGVGPGPAVR